MTGRFLALGDSYTIGEGVAPDERWPVRLARMLRADGIAVADPEIIAVTGWTTDELEQAIAAAAPRGPFALVTLLIGVNDQYRGRDVEAYRPAFARLLDIAVGLASADPARVVVLGIPDWGVSPFAADRDRAAIAHAIDGFNAAARDRTHDVGAAWVDVTTLSREAGADAAAYAADGLHPSGQAYAAWAVAALPAARRALAARRHAPVGP